MVDGPEEVVDVSLVGEDLVVKESFFQFGLEFCSKKNTFRFKNNCVLFQSGDGSENAF